MTGRNDGADLRERTTDFALRIMRLYGALPKTGMAQILGKQILRNGTSVGAQYREARRSRSNAEFVSKMGGALQEIEETAYWLELLIKGNIVPAKRLDDLYHETNELTAIFYSSIKTAKKPKRLQPVPRS
jgi:four helix bundle protein